MGYAFVTSTCCGCHRVFSYNPVRVPSIRMKNGKPDPDGDREPICMDCVERVNPRRIANGLDPITYAADAYDPCDERELR